MRFLSPEWIETVEAAVRTDKALQSIAHDSRFSFTIEATAAPPWAVSATLRVRSGHISLCADDPERVDAVGKATYQDWLAILRHELHPRKAALTGRLAGRGGLRVLRHHRLLDSLLDVLRSVPVDG